MATALDEACRAPETAARIDYSQAAKARAFPQRSPVEANICSTASTTSCSATSRVISLMVAKRVSSTGLPFSSSFRDHLPASRGIFPREAPDDVLRVASARNGDVEVDGVRAPEVVQGHQGSVSRRVELRPNLLHDGPQGIFSCPDERRQEGGVALWLAPWHGPARVPRGDQVEPVAVLVVHGLLRVPHRLSVSWLPRAVQRQTSAPIPRNSAELQDPDGSEQRTSPGAPP